MNIVAVFGIAVGLYLSSLYSYLLFHCLVEFATIAIGYALFILAWNSRRFMPNACLLLLGIGYAFISVIDLLHTLSYKGMNVFAGYGPNLPTQFWIAARYLQALTLCAAPCLTRRKIGAPSLASVYFLVVGLLVALAFSGRLPACFVEGKGLTPFKIVSEYVITGILLCSVFLFHRVRNNFDDRVYAFIVASILCTVASEMAFTAYVSVYGFANLLGHLFKLTAFYLIYRAILITGFSKPYELIFRDLNRAEEALQKNNEDLEILVRERTAELRDVNEQLQNELVERRKTEEMLQLQAFDLEQEVAERQQTEESLQAQAVMLQEEMEKRLVAQVELSELNRELEQRILERTAQLRANNEELLRAYDELKVTQGRMMQQEKMASIGQLAAGVAHEINNPIGFVISNLSSLGRYLEKVTAYLDANAETFAGSDPAVWEVIRGQRKKFKIDVIRQDLPELIRESLEGAERVRRIVLDLKGFSRVDAAELADADLHEGLESTLAIVWNELKYKATVTKDYGTVPRVCCNLGQINQVFMNLLVNAAQAIEKEGEIVIRTGAEGDLVRVIIADTGSGIPEEVQRHMFEPFFTTKEVGKGTGLGLSVVYDIIVNKHGGSIDVSSEVGKGTAFTITLPVGMKKE